MHLSLHVPRAPLDSMVELMTFYSGYAPQHHREKLIPDGAIQIIVDLTERPKKLFASETGPVSVDFRHAWISGMQQRWIVIEAQPMSSMLIIRFKPGGAYPVVGHDAETLSNAIHSLDDVLGAAAASLRDRLLDMPGPEAKFAAAEHWLMEQLRTPRPVEGAVQHVAARLRQPAGLRVRDLAEEAGLSERQMRNLFQRWVGVSPKQYARISRFQTVLRALADTGASDPALTAPALPSPDWAALAAECGYTDQSHLSHEFMAFAGMTPGAYIDAYRGLDNYLPITLTP